MLYFLLKPLVQLGIKIYFRNISISGWENLPPNNRFILAMNHPTAFMEPVIMAANLRKPVHFLARGDHFNKGFYRFLLEQAKMIPVFRQRESGFGSLKNNYDTFNRCYDFISKGEIVALFPEGRTEHEKRLRPLQRGIARIAFGTLSNFPEINDLYILPVSVNYSDALSFRGNALLHIGEPLSVKKYFGDGSQPNHQKLLDDLAYSLKQNMVVINHEEDDVCMEFCLKMFRNINKIPFLPIYNSSKAWLRREQMLTHFWNEEASSSFKIDLKEKVSHYANLLKKWNLDDKCIDVDAKQTSKVFLVFFSIFALLGYIFAFLPANFAETITKKKVYHLSFISPVRFGVAFGAYLIYALIFVILSVYVSFLFLPIVISLSLMSYFLLFYQEKWVLYRNQRRFLYLNKLERDKIITAKIEILTLFKKFT